MKLETRLTWALLLCVLAPALCMAAGNHWLAASASLPADATGPAAAARGEAVGRAARRQLAWSLACLAGASLGSWLALRRLRLTVVAPLRRLETAMREAARGAGGPKPGGDQPRGDEIRAVQAAFEQILARVQGLLERLSGGAGAVLESSGALSATAADLFGGAAKSKEQAVLVAAAAEEMSSNMKTMAESTERLSTGIRQVANSVEQMTVAIGEVARGAEDSARVAGSAASLAETSNVDVSSLGHAAEEIGKVIEVIQDIAEQTNLLALNATIEAARAGEAGKGFAVVATEVKELAKQTAAATDDIRGRIESIQSSTTRAVESISRIGEAIRNVNSLARAIASAVEAQNQSTREIAGSIAQAAEDADAVARGVGESAIASQEITRHVVGVQAGVEQASVGAAKTRLSGDELHSLAKSLLALASDFPAADLPMAAGDGKPGDGKPGAKGGPGMGGSGAVGFSGGLHQAVPAEVRESWRRVKDTRVLESFYERFLAADPRVAAHFAHTDMRKQKGLLAKSMIYVLNLAAGDEAAQQKVRVLGETHARNGLNVEPDLYNAWRNALLAALAEFDPKWSPALERAWRAQLAPALQLMTRAYGEAPPAAKPKTRALAKA